MDKIRVVVANRPRLMRELVSATICNQPDMEVVAEAQDESEITEVVDRYRPDYLIVALEDPDPRPGLCGFLLGRYPQMRVLALAPEQNTGIFYWALFDIRTRRIQTSEEDILNVLRRIMPSPDAARQKC